MARDEPRAGGAPFPVRPRSRHLPLGGSDETNGAARPVPSPRESAPPAPRPAEAPAPSAPAARKGRGAARPTSEAARKGAAKPKGSKSKGSKAKGSKSKEKT